MSASDQYSLGVVVYEWLCGDRPFHGTLTEVAVQHATMPPPSLREKVPTISPDVEQVVTTALAKDPKQRFGSVLAFATALEQASQVKQSEPEPEPVVPETFPTGGIPAAPAESITEFPVPTADSYPWGIAAGPDGNLWFTESIGNQIGRISPSGTITEFPVPTAISGPLGDHSRTRWLSLVYRAE